MQVNIVVTNRFVTLPVVFEHERFLVESLSLSGMYHVIARYGYNQNVQQDAAFVRGMLEHTGILLYQFLKMSIGASEDLEPVLAQGPISLSTLVAAGTETEAPLDTAAISDNIKQSLADVPQASPRQSMLAEGANPHGHLLAELGRLSLKFSTLEARYSMTPRSNQHMSTLPSVEGLAVAG
eukprot:jgi/Astpho2/6288/Aster-x1365